MTMHMIKEEKPKLRTRQIAGPVVFLSVILFSLASYDNHQASWGAFWLGLVVGIAVVLVIHKVRRQRW